MSTNHKHTRFTPVVSFSIAGALWLVAAIGGPVAYSRMKPLPLNMTRTVATTPATTALYNAERECPTNAPFSCYITSTESFMRRELRTSAVADKDETRLELQEQLLSHGVETPFGRTTPEDETLQTSEIFAISDSLQLIRHSTYPVLDPNSHLTVDAPRLQLGFNTGDFARDGLQYFFPFNTEKRSYQYFDVFAQEAWPLDYVREEGEHYIFEQKLPAINLLNAATRSYSQPTDISDAPAKEVDSSELAPAEQEAIAKLELKRPAATFYPAAFPGATTGTDDDETNDPILFGNKVANTSEHADDTNAESNADSADSAGSGVDNGTGSADKGADNGADNQTNAATATPDPTTPQHNPSLTPIELPKELQNRNVNADTIIALKPFYTVKRTIEVEPKSGVIIDQTEDLFFFYAYNQEEADTLAASPENQRTILRTSLEWDEQTQATAQRLAEPTVRNLQFLRMISFFLGLVALGFLGAGFIQIARTGHIRQRRHSPGHEAASVYPEDIEHSVFVGLIPASGSAKTRTKMNKIKPENEETTQ